MQSVTHFKQLNEQLYKKIHKYMHFCLALIVDTIKFLSLTVFAIKQPMYVGTHVHTSWSLHFLFCLPAVDGNWGKWSNWGACSVTCERGTQTRTRRCDDPAPSYNGKYCPHWTSGTESQDCGDKKKLCRKLLCFLWVSQIITKCYLSFKVLDTV
jgi:hypothetical protein